MRHAFFLIALFVVFETPAFAAYRVYYLKLEHLDTQGTVERIEHVVTTLDPYQYEHYHSGFRRLKIQMLKTWFCPGDTGGYRRYCSPPPEKKRGLASEDRTRIPIERQPYIPR